MAQIRTCQRDFIQSWETLDDDELLSSDSSESQNELLNALCWGGSSGGVGGRAASPERVKREASRRSVVVFQTHKLIKARFRCCYSIRRPIVPGMNYLWRSNLSGNFMRPVYHLLSPEVFFHLTILYLSRISIQIQVFLIYSAGLSLQTLPILQICFIKHTSYF